jgi:DNA-directed RNA polymerase I subunit RPA1
MNISTPVASEIATVDFSPLTTEEIKRISVKQIVNPLTFEPAEPGRVPIPILGGLYDPALGAWESLRQRLGWTETSLLAYC